MKKHQISKIVRKEKLIIRVEINIKNMTAFYSLAER